MHDQLQQLIEQANELESAILLDDDKQAVEAIARCRELLTEIEKTTKKPANVVKFAPRQ